MNRSILAVVSLLPLFLLLPSVGAAQVQPVPIDGFCAVAYEACSANCAGLGDPESLSACSIECDNAAALCSLDEEPALSSEEYLAFSGHPAIYTKAGACHATTSCPAEYGSCAAWSGYSDCGDQFCGISTSCQQCDPSGWPCLAGGPAQKEYRERYRVCFNEQMEGCTEYQRVSLTLSCGC